MGEHHLVTGSNATLMGAPMGAPAPAAYGEVFRDYRPSFIGSFSFNLGNFFALHLELLGIMIAIETTFDKGWRKLSIEYDSVLAIQAFKLVKET